jgi:uncharacterized membrane protein
MGGQDMIAVNWFLWFIVYSFIGWLYESVLCSVSERRLINRGFLTGPVCPVYGFGALAVIFVLEGRTDSLIVLFLASALLTCTLEYLTSYLLEKLFQTKWWDYSARKFNLNGRVSLAGAAVFGVLSVLLIQFIHPFVKDMTGRLPADVLLIAAVLAFIVLTFDTAFTVRRILFLNGRLSEIQTAINGFLASYRKRAEELKNAIMESFEQSEFYSERIRSLLSRNRLNTQRLLRAFPKLRSLKYEDALKKLKESLQSYRDREK